MGLFAAVSTCFRKYAVFQGRASRSEFWWFYLFYGLLAAVSLIFGPMGLLIVALALGLPVLAVGIRRLHDIDRSGWACLFYSIPFIGLILFILWNSRRGTAGDNRFGPNPFENGVADTRLAAPASSNPASMADKTEQLAKIKVLLESSAINQEEFDRMKQQILAG
jgi:uncharacterized membrane protein YhaH (DUF805 family)